MTTSPVCAVRARGTAGPECLDRVHDLLADLWRGAPDVGDEDRMLFEIAVVEIAGNVVEHAGPKPVDCQVELSVWADRLEATFHDTGDEAPVDLRDHGLPDELAETGRGLAMIRRAVDVLQYERVDDANRWHLLRVRTR